MGDGRLKNEKSRHKDGGKHFGKSVHQASASQPERASTILRACSALDMLNLDFWRYSPPDF